MKLTYLSTLLSGVLVANAGASAVITNFDDFATGAIGGQFGWYTSGLPDTSFITAFNTTANGVIDGTNAANIGGPSEAATAPTVGFYHSYGEELGRTSVNFEFAVTDSTVDPFAPLIRDTFAYTLYDGANSLFSISFVPQNTDPTAELDGRWNLFYTVGAGPAQSLAMYVFAGGLYSFDLDFSPNGAGTAFNFTVAPVGTPPPLDPGSLTRNGTFATPNTTVADNFGFEWKASDLPGGGGNNTLTANNLTVVPEPSSALLLGIAGLAFVSNRRRRA